MTFEDGKTIILQDAKFYWSVAVINQAKNLFERDLSHHRLRKS
nr:MAG TPA: hypothetical protein [Caudoviricetes sp.]